MNKMKSYVSPIVSFELSTNIAGTCGNPTHTPAAGTCGIDIGSMLLFLSAMTACTAPGVDDGTGGYCYHQPTEGNNLFNS